MTERYEERPDPSGFERNDIDRTPIPVHRGGGKLESTRALAEKGLPVPKSHYLYHPELNNPQLIAAAFRDLAKPLIVRGSHPNDWHGYIDVLPTFRTVRTEEELQHAIGAIQLTAASDDLRRHAADWDQPFSPEVHVLVQEQSRSPIAGSMMRHPHNLSEIHANYTDIEQRERVGVFGDRLNLSNAIIHDDGYVSSLNWEISISKEQLKEAGEIYKEVEQSGLVDPDWVYQMEIGLDPFMIYQLRPFKRREPAHRFMLPDVLDVNYPAIWSGLVFGITPPTGLRMRFVAAEFMEVYNGHIPARDDPYGLILGDRPDGSLPTDIMLGNLTGVLSKNNKRMYLEHGDYRLLKKSKFGLLDYHGENVNSSGVFYHTADDLRMFQDSYLWSNGDSGVLIPALYAKNL